MEQQSGAHIQYIAAFTVSLLGALYGLTVGWSSPSILLLTSDASPLPTGKITMEEASWIASLKSLGWFLSCSMFGVIGNKLGRKWPIFFLAIPSIVSWLLIWFAQNVYYIYVARLLHGITGAGTFILCQLYLVEISNDNIRGALGSSIVVSAHFGTPAAFALGAYLSYETIPICSIALSVVFAIVFFFFPETPLFLVKQNRILEAEKSIRFYRNIRSKNDTAIQKEIEQLRGVIGTNSKKVTVNWSDLMRNPGRRAMVIALFLSLLCNFSGYLALISYTATIFEAVGSAFSSNESALVVGIIQFISTTIVPILVERTKEILYIISTVGSTLGFTILGLYMTFKSLGYSDDGLTWIPIVSFSLVVFVQSLAISTLAFVVIAEVLPESLREFGLSFSNAIVGLSAFVVLKCLPLLTNSIGFHGTMFLFGGICVPGAIFICVYVPETKGKKYEEIMKSLQ